MLVLTLSAAFTTYLFLNMEYYGYEGVDFEFILFSGTEFETQFVVELSYLSVFFLHMISMVATMVYAFFWPYMADDETYDKLYSGIICFLTSMYFLVLSKNIFLMILGWELLGISSFFLVMYFASTKSFNSSVSAFTFNRIGDVFFLLAISLIHQTLTPCPWGGVGNVASSFAIFILISSMTKSAVFPFFSWLPRAMAAPTPVSALVHSSTLVTAGVYIVMQYHEDILASGISNLLTLLSFATVMVGGTYACFETDFKQIIAYSTMSHMGFIMFFVSLGEMDSALAHVWMHAIFKSILFMSAGSIIHNKEGQQDFRDLQISPINFSFHFTLILVSFFSMMGIPFLTGFVSKEVMAASMVSEEFSISSLTLFSISVVTTCIYSLRVIFLMGVTMSSVTHDRPEMKNLGCWAFFLLTASGVVEWKFFIEGDYTLLFMFLVKNLLVGLYFVGSAAVILFFRGFVHYYFPIWAKWFKDSDLGKICQKLCFWVSSWLKPVISSGWGVLVVVYTKFMVLFRKISWLRVSWYLNCALMLIIWLLVMSD